MSEILSSKLLTGLDKVNRREIRGWDPKPGTPKLAIGFVSNGWNVGFQFCYSLCNFIMYDWGPEGRHSLRRYIATSGLYIDDNRNNLTQMFLQDSTRPDYLLMLDSDIEFQPQDVYRMLDVADSIERPVISALYFTGFSREDLGVQPLWYIEKTPNFFSHFLNPINLDGNVLHQIDGCGAGCMLVHRSVFEKIAENYPDVRYKWFAHKEVNGDTTPVGEDLTFCQRIREAGFPIYGLGLVVNHCKMGRVNATSYVKDHPDYVERIPSDDPSLDDKVQLKKVA